jgi:hypothetical protein
MAHNTEIYHTKNNIMKGKLIYVTKKQVSNFIKRETERLKINKDELLKEVKLHKNLRST